MQQLILNVEDNRLAVFLQFLRTLNYVQVVPPLPNGNRTPVDAPKMEEPKHFLADAIGIMEGERGDDLAEIVSREFQEIEGEW